MHTAASWHCPKALERPWQTKGIVRPRRYQLKPWAPYRVANAVATTQGTLTLLNATLTLHPGTSYAPTQTLAVVAAFGGGVVNVENSIIDIPTTLGYGLQVMNTDPGGGLPGQAGSFAQINAANTIVRIGSGITGTGRTFGGFVAGESELNVTNGTFELGDYSTGIYNIFSTTYASPVLGSRTNLTDTSLTLGNRSVGWWGTGARAPARLSDTRGRFLVGEQSWGLYMTTGSFATLTDTQVQTGSNSYGAALVQGAELTLAGQAAITAAGTGSIGIDSNASRVFFNPGSLKVLGGKQGIVGSNAANFLLRSGGTLGVQGQSGEGAIYLDTGSQFTSEASSALNVSSPTGGGIFALGSQALLAGTVNVSAGRSAVYVRDSLGHVALSGGGTLASTNEDTEGVIAAEATQRRGFNGAWLRYVGHDGEHDGGRRGIYGDRGPDFDYRFDALQIGTDLYRHIDAGDLSRRHAGFYLAYGKGEGNVRHNYLDYRIHAGNDRFKAGSVGLYWTAFSAEGAYLDAVGQYTWYDMRVQSPRSTESFLDATGMALSLEGGWPFVLNDGDGLTIEDGRWRLEPQAQVIWQQIDVDDLREDTLQVSFEDGDSLVGRFGARLNRNGQRENRAGMVRTSNAWLRANLWHEFRGAPSARFATNSGYVPFAVDLGGSWGEVGLGGTWQVSDTGYLYADIDYNWSLDGDETAWNGKLGMRWNW